MLLFFFRLSFFSSLAYLLQSSSCSNCVYIYVLHFFWTPIWWTMYSREIINTDCHFWFRKRSVLRPQETDPTHGLIVVYIYIRLSGPKKKREIRIMLSPIFQVTLQKKNMRMCRFQFTCRLNADAIRFDPLFSVIWQNVAGMLIAPINWIVKDIGILCGKVSSPRVCRAFTRKWQTRQLRKTLRITQKVRKQSN